MKSFIFFGILFVLLFIGGETRCEGAVVGIDLGSTSFKIGVINGQTFDLVVNPEGQRKQPTLVGFHRGERVFGRDAERLWNRNPAQIYGYATQLLGKPLNHSHLLSQAHHFPYPMAADEERNAIVLPTTAIENESALTPEEIVGMILAQARATVKQSLEADIVDCVITVPPFYTQHERLALKNAASIAGYNVLSLMQSGTSLALNYAFTRSKEELSNDHYVIFYDMGASQTSVALGYFSHVPGNTKGKKEDLVPQAQIIATAWDDSLGGREFDWKLASHLADVATTQSGYQIRENPRAMASLLTEARRVKEVLSANAQAKAMVEGLINDFDFKYDVTREFFEQLTASLLQRVSVPIQKVLEVSGLKPADISTLEIVGGGSRIPAIQEEISKAFDGRPVSKHLNSDEASVMGATFFAASTSLRMKTQYKVKDILSYPIHLNIARGGHLEETDRLIPIIKGNNRLGWKKTISFNVSDAEDIQLDLFYPEADVPEGTVLPIADYTLSGTPTEEEGPFIGEPKVSITFLLEKSGLITLSQAEVQYTTEALVPKEQPKVEEPVVEKQEETVDEKTEEEEQAQPESSSNDHDENDSKEDNDDGDHEKNIEDAEQTPQNAEEETELPPPPAVEMVTVSREHSRGLKVALNPLGVIPLTSSQIQKGKSLLTKLDRAEKLKKDTAEARNTLEAHIYDWQDKIDSDQETIAHSTEKEREDLVALLADAGEWLYDQGADADLYSYRQKLNTLKAITDKIVSRIYERANFMDSLLTWNTTLPSLASSIVQSFEKRNISEEEKQEFWTTLRAHVEDLWNRGQEQEKLPLNEDPIVTIKEIEAESAWIEQQAKKFRSKPMKAKKITPKKIELEKPESNSAEQQAERTEQQTEQQQTEQQQTEQQQTEEQQTEEQTEQTEQQTEEIPETKSEESSDVHEEDIYS